MFSLGMPIVLVTIIENRYYFVKRSSIYMWYSECGHTCWLWDWQWERKHGIKTVLKNLRPMVTQKVYKIEFMICEVSINARIYYTYVFMSTDKPPIRALQSVQFICSQIILQWYITFKNIFLLRHFLYKNICIPE